jgi:hypothetical protein
VPKHLLYALWKPDLKLGQLSKLCVGLYMILAHSEEMDKPIDNISFTSSLYSVEEVVQLLLLCRQSPP